MDEGINSYIGFKKFPKLGSKDCFEKWFRNLKAEINTIPLCAGSFEKGPLQHPRAEPVSEQHIFVDDDGNFNGELYRSAMMLYNMLGMLVDKISKFLYSMTMTWPMKLSGRVQTISMFCVCGYWRGFNKTQIPRRRYFSQILKQ